LGARVGIKSKLARRRACFARLLESLEPRLLLSTTYTAAASSGFSLSGTTLSYTDTSNNPQTATVANGDVLSGGEHKK